METRALCGIGGWGGRGGSVESPLLLRSLCIWGLMMGNLSLCHHLFQNAIIMMGSRAPPLKKKKKSLN